MRLFAVVLLLAAAIASARADEDIDNEVARRHFLKGSELYAGQRYEEALAEFQRAMVAKPLPAFHYNMARCYDRLERYQLAVDAYRSYLAAVPASPERRSIEERIAELEERIRLLPKPPVVEEPAPLRVAAPVGGAPSFARRHVASIVLGSLAIALLAGGTAAEVIARMRFDDAQRSCKPACPRAVVDGITTPETAGYAVLAVAGAAAVGTIVAIILETRASHRLRARAGGLEVVF